VKAEMTWRRIALELPEDALTTFIRKMPKIDNINFNYKFKTTKVSATVIGLVIF
jgi:hypothetical protein